MKKIRFLAIFLVILMLVTPVLTACNNDSGDGESSSDEESTTTTSRRKTTSSKPGDIDDTKEGYVIYQDFNKRPLGAFTSVGNVASASKNGVSYSVVESGNLKEGETVARALYFYREAMDITDNRDGFINITPAEIDLADVYALEFDLMVTDKTNVNIAVNGRKAASSGTKFNEFVRYEAGTGRLMANNQLISEIDKDEWYTVTIMINDQNKLYDIYLNGYKMLGEVEYKDGTYPTRSECGINLYRITMSGGTNENEFYLDNVSVYKPDDENNRPKDYKGNKAVTYEQINMPDITLFDANDPNYISYKVLEAIMGDTKVNMNGCADAEGNVVSGKTDLKDGFRFEAVSPDGTVHYPLADNWGDEFKAVEEGYSNYLFLDGYDAGFNNASFLFDPTFMEQCGIPVLTGKEVKEQEKIFTGSDAALFYDISNYSSLTIEFFMPLETRSQKDYYQFMLYLASGNRWPEGDTKAGISYYNAAYKTNDTKFSQGFYTMTVNIGSLGGTRQPSLTTITGIEFKFSGWNNTKNGANTNGTKYGVDYFLSNDHPIAIKSIKLSGGVKVPVKDPAEGMENCTHTLEDGSTAMTEREVINPTCIDYGYTADKCTLCGKTTPVQNDVSLLKGPVGHNYGSADESSADYNERDIIYPTCTAGGSASAKCIDCGFEAVQEKYAPLGHAYITKIDTIGKKISNSCPICGAYEATEFADSMPTYGEIMDAITNAGYTFEAGFVGISDLKSAVSVDNTTKFNPADKDNTYDKPSFGTRFNILLRGAKVDVITEGADDEKVTFLRFYNNRLDHSYAELNGCRSKNSEDMVFEFSIRLSPNVDGKYGNFGDFQLIDRSSAAHPKGENFFHKFASLTTEGKIETLNTDFDIQLSETEFTNVAYVFRFGNNTLDIYVNGILKIRDVPIDATGTYAMASFCPDELRFFQLSNAPEFEAYIDIAHCVAYTASFPVGFTDVAIDGVIPDYSGEILNETEFTVSGADVKYATDPLKKNSTYYITIDYKAGTTPMATDGVLFAGTKSNYYGEALTENILTVNEFGDILFYNQIIGNTAEDAVIVISVNEDNNTVTAYVNGEYAATGWYTNADYYKTEDKVYLTGFVFGCAEGADYTIASFVVHTGIYEEVEAE